MTIDEAIKELSRIAEEPDEDWLEPEYRAIELGIEALKREKAWRGNPRWGIPPLMPGETE